MWTSGRCDIDCSGVCNSAVCDPSGDGAAPYHGGQTCLVSGCPLYTKRARATPWATSAWYLTNEVYGTDLGLGFQGEDNSLQQCKDKCLANEHCTAIFGDLEGNDGSCWTSTSCTLTGNSVGASCPGLAVHQNRYRVHFRPT